MTEFLQRDRANLTPFGLTLYCHGLVTLKDKAKLQTVVRDLWGFLRTDESKRKVWLETPGDQRKNRWYGNHMATQAAFLQLLVRIDPNHPLLPKVARYLVSRRANGTYWNSTYDTACCVEALSDFLSVQEAPEPTETSAQIWISGRLRNTVKISAKDRFRSLEAWKLEGRTVPTGNVLVQVRKKGTGSVCFSGLLKTFSPEDALPPSGDLVTISRSYYVLDPVGETDGSPSRFTRYKRRPFTESTNLVRGNLIEVELTVESKATLDKMVVSDFRPAGFTPVNIREGYTENDLGAFVEHRNDRTIYFTPRLSEGSRYTVSYRMRADSSGSFTALPATVSGIFSPDVKANSGIIRVQVLE